MVNEYYVYLNTLKSRIYEHNLNDC